LVAGLWAALACGVSSCGYHTLYGRAQAARISVTAGLVLTPDTNAAQAALSGARAELAAAGRLASGGRFPRLTIDLLRVDEVSRGIHVQTGQPAASGMGVAVVVRGRLLLASDQEPAVDTGDVRRAVQTSGDANPSLDATAYDQAVRSAAERAGRAVARLAQGIPEPNDDAP
jgi:hypothetical protein